jgi:TrmH family RNA methyltransferase
MISRMKMKQIHSLSRKKNRELQKQFLVEGEKMVKEFLEGSSRDIPLLTEIFATEKWIEVNNHLLEHSGIEICSATEQELGKASNLVTPQPVIAVARIPETNLDPTTLSSELVLGFEAIRDPGNLGTIIRTADWFGISQILCTPDSVDQYNPKVVQATMGAIARVQVHYVDLEEVLSDQSFQNKPVYGTFLGGENIYTTQLERQPLIIFGNESKGLSSRYNSHIKGRISIPSFAVGGAGSESLNLASSVAVVCSELKRRE